MTHSTASTSQESPSKRSPPRPIGAAIPVNIRSLEHDSAIGEAFADPAVVPTRDPSTQQAVERIAKLAESIEQQCSQAVRMPPLPIRGLGLSRQTLGLFLVVTLILFAGEFFLLLQRASVTQFVALGVGELILYCVVGISAFNDLNQSRRQQLQLDFDARVEQLTGGLAELVAARADLQNELLQLQQRRSDVDEQVRTTQAELEARQIAAQNQTESLVDVERQIAATRLLQRQEQAQLERCTAESIVAHEKFAELTAQLHALNASLDASRREKALAQAELVELQTKLRLNHESQEAVTLKLGVLGERVQLTAQQLQDQESELQSQRELLAETQLNVEQQQQIEREIGHQQAVLDALKQTEQDLHERLAAAETEQRIAQFEQQIATQREQITQQNVCLENINHHLLEGQQACRELDDRKGQLIAELDDLQRTNEGANRRLAESIVAHETLQDETQRLQIALQRLKDETACCEQAHHELQLDLVALEADRQSAIAELGGLEQAAKRSAQQEASLQLRIPTLSAKVDSLNDLVEAKRQQVIEIKEHLSKIRGELEDAQEHYDKLEAAKQQEQVIEQRLGELEQACTRLEENRHALRSQLDEEAAALVAVQRNIAQESAALEQQSARGTQLDVEQQRALVAHQMRLESEQRAADTAIAAIHQERQHLLAELAELKGEVQLASEQLGQLRQTAAALQAEHELARSGAEDQLRRVQQRIVDEELRLDNLLEAHRTSVDGLERQREALASEIAQLFQAVTEQAEYLKNLERERHSSAEHLERSRSDSSQLDLHIAAQRSQAEEASRRLAATKQDLLEVESQHARANRELQALGDRLHDRRQTEADVAAIERRVLDAQAVSEQLQLATELETGKLNGLRREEAAVRHQLGLGRDELNTRQAEIDRLQAKLNTLQASVSTHASALHEEQTQLEELFKSQQSAQQQLALARQELAELDRQQGARLRDIQILDERRHQAESRLRELESSLQAAQQVSNEWEQYVTAKQQEANLKQRQIHELERELQEKQLARQKTMDDVQNAEMKLRQTNDRLQAVASDALKAQQNLSLLTNDIHGLNQKRESILRESSQVEHQLHRNQIELQTVVAQLEDQRAASSEESLRLQLLEQSKNKTLAELSRLEEEQQEAELKLSSSQQQATHAMQEVASLNQQLHEIRTELREHETERTALRQLRHERGDAERQAVELSRQIEEAHALFDGLMSKVLHQTQLLDELDGKIEVRRGTLDREHAQVQALEQRRNELELELVTLTEQRTHSDAEAFEVQQQLEQCQRQQAQLQREQLQLTAGIEAYQSQLQIAREEADRTATQYASQAEQAETLQREIVELGSQRDTLRREIELEKRSQADREQEIATANAQLDGVKATLGAHEAQKRSLLAELEEREHEAERSRAQADGLRAKLEQAQELEKQLASQFASIASEHERLQKEVREFERRRQDLNRELEAESRVLAKIKLQQQQQPMTTTTAATTAATAAATAAAATAATTAAAAATPTVFPELGPPAASEDDPWSLVLK